MALLKRGKAPSQISSSQTKHQPVTTTHGPPYQLKKKRNIAALGCVAILFLRVLLHIILSYDAVVTTESSSLIKINDTSTQGNREKISQVDASSCTRLCPHFNNRIIVELPVSTLQPTSKAGLLDRTYIMRAWANVGRFLCAQVKIPAPKSWLTAKHNTIGYITNTTSFEKDFLYFVDADNPDQIILSDRIDVQEPEDGWGLRLTSTVNGSSARRVMEHFFQANEFMKQQDGGEKAGEQRRFLWKVRGRYHDYNMHFMKFLYELKGRSIGDDDADDSIPSHQIPKWERYEDDLCVGALKMESTGIQQTARRVIQKLKSRFSFSEDEPLNFGYLHVRRGDSKKTEGDKDNGQLCDTELPKMASYLECTFHEADFQQNVSIPLLVGSDETDATYRKRLFSLINNIPSLQAVDLDKEVLDEIKNEIASGVSPPHKRNNYSIFLISNVVVQDASFYLRQHRVWCNDCDANLTSLDQDESRKWWSNGWLPVDWQTGLSTYQKQANPFRLKVGIRGPGPHGGHHGPRSTQSFRGGEGGRGDGNGPLRRYDSSEGRRRGVHGPRPPQIFEGYDESLAEAVDLMSKAAKKRVME